MVDDSVEQLLSKALAEKGLQIEISNNLKMAYSITIDTSVHDKQIRTDAIEEVKSKMISFHTDKVFQYGTDIIEAKADAFDELKDWLEKQSKK